MPSARLASFVFLVLGLVVPGAAGAQDPADELALQLLLQQPVDVASRYRQAASAAPASVRVVTAEEIERFGWVTLDELLATIPGFAVSDDRNYAYVGVRGVARPTDYNNRVLLLLDGHPLNDGFYGLAPIGPDLGVDLRGLERVEIVRGPGSALFGTNAMLAMINLVSKSASVPRVWAETGAFGRLRTGLAASVPVGDAVVHVDGGWERSDGEDLRFPGFADGSSEGVARGLDGGQRWFGSVTAERGGLVLRSRVWNSRKDVPTASWESDFGDPRLRTEDTWGYLQLGWTGGAGTGRTLSTAVSADRYDYDGWYPIEGLMTVDGTRVHRARAETQLTWDLRPDNRLVVGGEVRHHSRGDYFLETEGDTLFYGDHPYTAWSVFVQDEHTIRPELVLLLGLRYDARAGQKSRASPRGALVWSPRPGTALKALYGSAYRVPSLFELYYEDDSGFRASEGLGPETVRTAELVWEQGLADRLALSVSLFDSRVRDLIDTIEDGEEYRFINLEAVVARGAEAELQMQGARGVQGLSYAYVRARDDEGIPLSNVPEHVVRASAMRPLLPPVRGAAQLRYESGRLTLAGDRTGGALLLDLRLTTDPLAGRFGAWAGVRNVLNTRFMVPGGYEHIMDAIPQPGRRWDLGGEVRFR